MQTAQQMKRTSQNQREVIFDLPHPPGQGRFKQFLIPGSEKLDLSGGCPKGDGNRAN